MWELELYVYTKDKIFDINKFNIGKRFYYHISALDFPTSNSEKFKLMTYIIPGVKRRIFSLDLHIGKQQYIFTYHLNKSYIEIMNDFPRVEYDTLFDIPLSDVVYKSLIPQIKKIIDGKNQYTSVRNLLSFVRKSSLYMTDQESFGKEKPMTPKEALYYNTTDCEDRAALFYYLVKELVDLPLIILEYPNHINIGVCFPDTVYGQGITYKGKNFSICEPSESGSDYGNIGQHGQKYNPKIVGAYVPKS